MRYKAGDKVRVRKDLKIGVSYGMLNNNKYRDIAASEMVNLAGQIVEISDVNNTYKVKGNSWNWTDEMFEPVNAQKIVITCDAVETLARLYDGNKVVKTATAKCSTDDAFDFKTGAMLAFERLMSEEKKPKFEVGKQYQGKDFVIEITSAEKLPHDVRYRFKAIKGDAGNLGFFDKRSAFGELLKPYDPPKYFSGKAVCVEVGNAFFAYTKGKVYEFKDGKTINDNNTEVHTDGVTSIAEWNNKWGQRAKMLEIVE